MPISQIGSAEWWIRYYRSAVLELRPITPKLLSTIHARDYPEIAIDLVG
jgi:hypothetical protein